MLDVLWILFETRHVRLRSRFSCPNVKTVRDSYYGVRFSHVNGSARGIIVAPLTVYGIYSFIREQRWYSLVTKRGHRWITANDCSNNSRTSSSEKQLGRRTYLNDASPRKPYHKRNLLRYSGFRQLARSTAAGQSRSSVISPTNYEPVDRSPSDSR